MRNEGFRRLFLASTSFIAAIAFPVAADAAAGELAGPLVNYSEERAPCRDRSATRNAYFGDLHVHTGFSYDALPLGINTTPADAYRFARGEPLGVPPFDAAGEPQSVMQLRVPLDFTAVTDHAEYFGEFALCTDADARQYGTSYCQALRGEDRSEYFSFLRAILDEEPERISELCGEDGQACRAASSSVWEATQAMAEAAYDRSENCSFTSFVAYEYTGTPNSNNLHRNVIFRNATVPSVATSYVDAPSPEALWQRLREDCLESGGGCDVLAIPHNSNISAGAMFAAYAGSGPMAADRARERNAMEPLIEVFQHKGNSECFNGLPGIFGEPDELCNEEQVMSLGAREDREGVIHDIRFCAEGEVGKRGFSRFGCIAKNDFFRSVLLTGLADEAAIGVNSYRLGVIASTDTHTSVAGASQEATYQGHLVLESTLTARLGESPYSPMFIDGNPGGLAGVWAVENSRDALFEAMKQREVFGTSGTRIKPRLFAGWSIDANACELGDPVSHGYQNGVPMGADMNPAPAGAKARFLLMALRDPNASPLEKLQLVKGWIDEEGQSRYAVLDAAAAPVRETGLDMATGEWTGGGVSSFCTVYEDADFDPGQLAYYYLRAVEVPSLRWNWAQCLALPVDDRPEACASDAPRTVREMAWTSPVWYSPSGESED